MTSGIQLIVAERKRQVSQEGWSSKHDDRHRLQEMSRAALCYLESSITRGWLPQDRYEVEPAPPGWPWERKWWKPKNKIRDLVRAGALIAAEIDRLQRLEAQ
jgi:hypothetical protein